MTAVNLVLSFFCIFEIICVPAIFLRFHLWLVILLDIAAMGALCIWLGLRKKLPWQRKKTAVCKTANKEEPQNSARQKRLQVFCILLVLLQVVLVAGYRHTDDDDAMYLGIAASAYETGELFAYWPYTGNAMELSDAGDYVLSPLPILWAALGKTLHLHPTILAHTIVSIFMVLFVCLVYWLLAKRLFPEPDGSSAYVFFLLINLLNLFGYFSTRTSSVFLLFRSWQGKAIFCAVMVPLMFYYFLGLLGKNESEQKESFLGMYLTMGAGCLTCFTAVMLMPLLLLALALTYAVAKRSLRLPLQLCGALLPNAALILIYLFVL